MQKTLSVSKSLCVCLTLFFPLSPLQVSLQRPALSKLASKNDEVTQVVAVSGSFTFYLDLLITIYCIEHTIQDAS